MDLSYCDDVDSDILVDVTIVWFLYCNTFFSLCRVQPVLVGWLYTRTPQIVPSCLLKQESRDFFLYVCHVPSELEQTGSLCWKINIGACHWPCWAFELLFFFKTYLFSIRTRHLGINSRGEKKSTLKHFVRICFSLHRTDIKITCYTISHKFTLAVLFVHTHEYWLKHVFFVMSG